MADYASIAAIRPIDCFRILANLERKDITNAEVARILNVPAQTVNNWKRKWHPNELNARRLMALHELYFPDVEIPFLGSQEPQTA